MSDQKWNPGNYVYVSGRDRIGTLEMLGQPDSLGGDEAGLIRWSDDSEWIRLSDLAPVDWETAAEKIVDRVNDASLQYDDQ